MDLVTIVAKYSEGAVTTGTLIIIVDGTVYTYNTETATTLNI